RRAAALRDRGLRRRRDRRRAPPREHHPAPRRPRAEARRSALRVSIAVIGGGSWGTALAIHVARSGAAVRLWAREREVVGGRRTRPRGPWYLADIHVPSSA